MGSYHRAVITRTTRTHTNVPAQSRTTWNFKRANWGKYKTKTEENVKQLNAKGKPKDELRNLTNIIVRSAKNYVPGGKVKNYTPFWNTKLQTIKTERNRPRKVAERTKNPSDVQNWRRQNAALRKEIIKQKRTSFHNLITNIGYAPKGKMVYNFIKIINNYKTNRITQPIIIDNKSVTDNEMIARKLNSFYAKEHKLNNYSRKKKQPQGQSAAGRIRSTENTTRSTFKHDSFLTPTLITSQLN
jgi:hypothetical protein